MTIWTLKERRGSTFAEPAFRGAWSPGKLCKECTASSARHIPPLIVEWEPGSDQVADISWASTGCPVITQRVHELLSARFRGYEPGPVQMTQHPRLKRPQCPNRRTKPRVWLPYEGPPLFEVQITARPHMDAALTTATLVKRCSRCGYTRWVLEGFENWEHQVQVLKEGEEITGYKDRWIHHARVPGKGLFVRAADLAGCDIFQVHEFPGWPLCTDRVKQFIQEQGFSNVAFMEMGEVVE